MTSAAPESPEAASTVTPSLAASVYAPRSASSAALPGKVSSVALKLWLITSPRWWSSTYRSAATICGKPCTPSVSDTGVSTSRMFAPGAITCAHSTSSVVSPAQPTMSEFLGLYRGVAPDRRRAERVHDDDRGAAAGHARPVQRGEVVGLPDLAGLIAGDLVGSLAVGGGGRAGLRAAGTQGAGPDDDAGQGRCSGRPRARYGRGGELADGGQRRAGSGGGQPAQAQQHRDQPRHPHPRLPPWAPRQ